MRTKEHEITNKQSNKHVSTRVNNLAQQTTQLANENVEEERRMKKKEEVYRFFDHLSISVIDYQKLLDLGWNKKQIDLTLDSIQNYSKNKNYKNLYLTSKKWLEKEPKASEVKNKFASPII
jgi:glyceraldehyde-3-phosphate dehydrogenase/erythrose-4-phosphate dehydrogenase